MTTSTKTLKINATASEVSTVMNSGLVGTGSAFIEKMLGCAQSDNPIGVINAAILALPAEQQISAMMRILALSTDESLKLIEFTEDGRKVNTELLNSVIADDGETLESLAQRVDAVSVKHDDDNENKEYNLDNLDSLAIRVTIEHSINLIQMELAMAMERSEDPLQQIMFAIHVKDSESTVMKNAQAVILNTFIEALNGTEFGDAIKEANEVAVDGNLDGCSKEQVAAVEVLGKAVEQSLEAFFETLTSK